MTRIGLPLRCVIALTLTAPFAGCGQKGALYLPIAAKSVVAPVVSDQFADINGVSLRYQISGAGSRNIVLLHEMGMALESWDDIMPILNASHRVLRYDLRGFGKSARIRGSVTIDDEVADLRGLLDRVGINEPVTLMGGAVGAAIALRFASTYPQRTNAVMAISPATGVAVANRAGDLANADLIERLGVAKNLETTLEGVYPATIQAGHADRVARFVAMQGATDAASMAATLRMIATTEWETTWPRIQCPTWIVAARLDPTRSVESMQVIADTIPAGLGHVEVLDTGHFMAIQSPELLRPLLQKFLSAVEH